MNQEEGRKRRRENREKPWSNKATKRKEQKKKE